MSWAQVMHYLFTPIPEEKLLFLELEQLLISSHDWAQGGCHLQGDNQENKAPKDDMADVGHSQGTSCPQYQYASKSNANTPE